MLGCDIIEISRIEEAVQRHGERFVRRVLTADELEIYTRRKEAVTFLAGRFAAKEAIAKALKTGIGEHISFTGIAVLPGERGEPVVYIQNAVRSDIEVSISHSRDYAMAVCIRRNG